MKFAFTCELCKKDVKRGDKFHFDLWVNIDDIESDGVECVDSICKSCSDKIVNKIKSLTK
jgi:hypothetical protein